LNTRLYAIQCLDRILHQKHKADSLLDDAPVQETALLHELMYGVLRRVFSLEADVSRFLKDKPEDFVRAALLMGAYQIRHMRVPAFAAVHATVETVKIQRPKAAGYVNAVLRKVAANEPPKKLKPNQRAELPQWMFASWRDAFGIEAVQAVAGAMLIKPELCLAVFGDLEMWMDEVRGAGFDTGFELREGELSPHAVLLPSGMSVLALPGYETGAFTVMDQAAQAAVLALPVKAGDTVLDLCAAPGGKAMLLARLHPEATIVAVEKVAARIPRLQENLARVHASNVMVQQGDVTALQFPDNHADAILLDAPCTASGVLRRHPDAKLLHDKQDVLRHAKLQKELLAEALRVLKPGGQLVYAVCSIHPEENEQVVECFDGLQSSQRLLPSANHDGFFIARFTKGEA